LAVVFKEVILAEAALEGGVAVKGPFQETAVGDPIGDVAFGDLVTGLEESLGDSFVGDAFTDHATGHVALGFGKLGESARAGAALERGGRSLDDGGG
jgi:hypothetical protein